MSEHLDPFDRLSAMAPGLDDGHLAPGDDPRADALLARVVAMPVDAVPTRSGRRRARWIAAAVVVGAVGAGGAVAAIRGREAADPASISCYSEAAAEPRAIVGLVSDGSDAAAQCVAAWAERDIPEAPTGPLQACVDTTDALVVVPGEPGTCELLGWVPSVGVTERVELTAKVDGAIVGALAERCIGDADEAIAAVEQALADAGASGWRVTAVPSQDGTSTCYVPSIDDAAQAVVLVAIADPGN